MPKVTFIEHNGTAHTVEAVAGQSLMRAAVDNGVPGIDADCGGECACATCHVYVEAAWLARTGERSEMEQSMLSFAAVTQDNSRLSCQVQITPALDGLVVSLPEGQH
jgi:2Fe-2S ferredoxin